MIKVYNLEDVHFPQEILDIFEEAPIYGHVMLPWMASRKQTGWVEPDPNYIGEPFMPGGQPSKQVARAIYGGPIHLVSSECGRCGLNISFRVGQTQREHTENYNHYILEECSGVYNDGSTICARGWQDSATDEDR